MINYDLLTDRQEFLTNFNKRNYKTAYEHYKDKLSKALEGVETGDVDSQIDAMLDTASNELSTLKKRKQEILSTDLRVIIALYLIPAAKGIDTDVSNLLADSLVNKWNERFPEPKIEASGFEEINAGFTKSLSEMFGFKSLGR